LGEERIRERAIIETQQNTVVSGNNRIYLFHTRNLTRYSLQNLGKSILVLTLHELNDVADIVAVNVQMPLRSRGWYSARGVGVEIR
jgi:hypothetical protein